MPSLKIKSWTWEKITTERQVNDADSPVLVSHRIDGLEKVRAVFEIIDGEPFARTRNSKALVRPEMLVADLTSTNGQPWHIGWKSTILATNVLKSGGEGARVEIHRVWFPDWVKSWTEDRVLASSPVGEWINAEYPR